MTDERIIERDSLTDFRKRNAGIRIVFTNGCFDLLHRGHLELLNQARELGDCLVVGLNDDRSVGRLKGEGRPLMSEEDRAFMILQLRCVDYVTVFGEDTPLETIRALSPDILVKGAEYDRDDIVGADFVEKSGGRVERVEMVGGFSTSDLIRKIKGE